MPAIILTKEGAGRTVFPLGRAILLIGRDPVSGVFLDSDVISKNHASIIYQKGDYVVCDNGSSNGTFVNGVRIKKETLRHKDLISFGPYHFQVDLESEGKETSLPSEVPSHLDRSGQEYRRLVDVSPVTGSEASGPMKVMMSEGTPQPRVVEPVRSISNVLLYMGLGALAVIAALAIFAWVDERQDKNKIVEGEKNQIADLHKINDLNEGRIHKLEADLNQTHGELNRTVDELKNADRERTALKKQVTQTQDALRQASEDLKSTNAKFAALNKKITDSVLAPKEEVKPVLSVAPSREVLASRLAPIAYLPNFDSVPKISIVKETEVPVKRNEPVVGTLKIPLGQSYAVLGAETDALMVDMGGEKVRIPKDKTDFQALLDEANLSRKKENERLYMEREHLIDKMVAEETAAGEQAEKEKVAYMKSKIVLGINVQGFLQGGLLGVKTDAQTVYMLLTGVDSHNVAVGDVWKGDAYPMGLFTKPGTEIKCRHYTADLKEFSAFVKSGSQDDPVARLVEETTLKDLKAIEAQITAIMTQLDSLAILKEGDAINALDAVKGNEFRVSIATKKFFTTAAPKIEKAAELAVEYSKNTPLNPKVKTFLEHVTTAAGICSGLRFQDFMTQIHKIDTEANDLKGWLLLSINANEKKN